MIDVVNDDTYLERLSGLSSLHESCPDMSNEEELSDESWTDISSIVTNDINSKGNLCSASEVYIPILDLSSNATEQELANVLNKAAIQHGFFAVRGHGISFKLIKRHLEMQKNFFSLPLEEKMKIVVDNNNRGYTPIGEETLDPSNSTVGDQREGLYFGREIPSDDPRAKLPLHGPNQWPDEKNIQGYKETVEEYMQELTQFGIRLLSIVSLSLGLDRNYLNQYFKEPMIFLRPLHYL
jgi:isopenicillin N synthase-like dioxygenase